MSQLVQSRHLDFIDRAIFPKLCQNKFLLLSQINEQDNYDTIKQLPNKKFEDDMRLSNYLIEKINPIITTHLTIIFNNINNEPVYPSCLKTAKTVPVFKEGYKSLPCNYKPTSLVPVIEKIFEKTTIEANN